MITTTTWPSLQSSMEKQQHHLLPLPVTPWEIRSNSAYEADDQSSVASNTSILRWRRPELMITVSQEEERLREELGKEIEKELERELMDGIAVLVHRLSDLRARQIVRVMREETTSGGDEDVDVCMQRRKGGVRKSDVRERKVGRARGGGRERSGAIRLSSMSSDAETTTSSMSTVISSGRVGSCRKNERIHVKSF